jgi:hypothetical protein
MDTEGAGSRVATQNDVRRALEDESGEIAFELLTSWIAECEAGSFADFELLRELLSAIVDAAADAEWIYESQLIEGLTDFCDQLDMQDGQLLELVADFALGLQDPNLEVLVAANPAAPEHVLRRLSDSDNGWEEQETAERVAMNPSTPVDVLVALAASGTGSAKFEVARNPRTPADVVAQLLQGDDCSDVQINLDNRISNVSVAAAGNANCAPVALDHATLAMSKRLETMIASAVDSQPSTAARSSKSSAEPDGRVVCQLLAALVANPSTPLSAIQSCDSVAGATLAVTESMRSGAARPGMPPEVDYSDLVSVLVGFASGPPTSDTTMMQLAQHPDEVVRSRVASNMTASQECRAVAGGASK